MKGTIVSFRRGRRTYKPRQFIIQIESIKTAKQAEKLISKKATWKSPQGKEIKGTINKAHGKKGCVRVLFEKGLPGQALASKVDIS